MSLPWCTICGTEHTRGQRCPGVLVASGPEAPAWRVTVETPRGMQGYAVMVAAVGERWRARILTYPNVMWTVPGGGSSMKFVGRTLDEAQQKAIAFIRLHCGERSYLLHDDLEPVSDTVFKERVGRSQEILEPRYERNLHLRFGYSRPTMAATTLNISESGMFVSTPRPLAEGVLAGLLLELEYGKVPLRGSVIWKRTRPQLGRLPGMGLSLIRPPSMYVRYVQALG